MNSVITDLVDKDRLRSLIDGVIIDYKQNGRFRVNRKAFVDQTIFELERDLIFGHSWLYAAHVSELSKPLSFVTRTLAGRIVFLASDDARHITGTDLRVDAGAVSRYWAWQPEKPSEGSPK